VHELGLGLVRRAEERGRDRGRGDLVGVVRRDLLRSLLVLLMLGCDDLANEKEGDDR